MAHQAVNYSGHPKRQLSDDGPGEKFSPVHTAVTLESRPCTISARRIHLAASRVMTFLGAPAFPRRQQPDVR